MSITIRWFVVLVCAALLVGAAVFAKLRSAQQPRFPYLGRPLSEADYQALAARPGWRAWSTAVDDGVRLRGLLREPASADADWVLFFNGNSATMLAEGQQFLDALCADRGCGALTFAYRGYDGSGGSPSPDALEADASRVFETLLRERGIAPGRVHVVGFSLGTDLAASAAAHAGSAPASLTLLAPMTQLYLGERTDLRLDHYETRRWLAGIACNVLLVHGIDDATLGIGNSRQIAAQLGGRAMLVELPGVGHYELPRTPAALDALRRFIAARAPN